MTVAASARKAGPYAGNGVTTSFPFTFKVFARTDVALVFTNLAGVASTLVLDSDYSVLLNLDQDASPGGTVTYPIGAGVVLPTGSTLTMIGALGYDQATDLTNAGRFNPDVVERAIDKVTILAQQLKEVSDRTLRAAVGTAVNLIFPSPSSGKFIRWRTDLTGLENVEAGTDSVALQGLLADNTLGTRGGGMIGFDSTKTFPASTVGSAIKPLVNIPDFASSANGSALVGYKSPFTGAVGRTLSDKLQDRVSAKDFGLSTANTGAQNVTAINAAIAYAISQGGATIYIPRGTYDFNATISLTGANGVRITGEGPDATVLRITHATANFFESTGSTYYQTIDNLTLASAITRTGGSMFYAAFWARGLMHRVKIKQHFDGVQLVGFEQSTLSEVFIVSPSGAGTALIAGTTSATNTGANLNLLNCFLRGFDEFTQAQPPTGLVGIAAYDIEALFTINSDIGNFLNQAVVLSPLTRMANCHFVQTYFDGTKLGDNVLITGNGIKQQFQFTGCWFNGAGNMTSGSNDCFGVNAVGPGEYYDINFTGCRFLSTKGSAFYSSTRYLDFSFVGCVFTNCGFGGGAYKHAVHFQPSGASLKSPIITGCKFQGSGAKDIKIETNANGVVVTGNSLGSGIQWTTGTLLGACEGNYDASATPVSTSVASASSIVIPATCRYCVITGTTTINAIQTTFPGHQVSFRTTGALTWADDGGNLRLVGNYVTTSNSVLTLVCEANGDWREVARATS